MKKMNNKGFMLTETLIVATLLITVLLIVYVQFKSINRKINNNFTYNTVSSLYNLYSVKQFIEQDNYSALVSVLDSNDYVDITECSDIYFNNPTYCNSLIVTAGIEQLLLTKENIYSIIEGKPFDENMNDYISQIKYEPVDGYRLIASFKDGTYASLRVLNDEEFDEVIANSCILKLKKTYSIYYKANDGTEIMPTYYGTAGCSEVLDISNEDRNENACYYASSYSTDSLKITEVDGTNTATIYYEKYTATLTIHHKATDGTTIYTDTVVTGDCGTTYYPESYKKVITGYNYSNTTTDEVTLTKNNVEVTLYYAEGSASDE